MEIRDQLAAEASASKDVPALATLQSAIYGAVRFAESLLEATGMAGVRLTRVICTPDARLWTLAFGDLCFEVEVQDDGFSVRTLSSFGPSATALAA